MRPRDAVYQMAFMVEALEPACERWAASLGAGPFFLFDPFSFIDPVYKGAPAEPGIAIALGFSGSLCIELMVRRDTAPSVFDEAQTGQLHHVARLTDDIDATLARYRAQGTDVPFEARFYPDTRMAFADTRAALGCWTEIIAYNPDIEAALAMIETAHQGWDGKDPCRRL
jgi:hypothetical protein